MQVAVCPQGHNITGTLERLYGVAGFAGTVRIDQHGKIIEPEHDGYTEIDWNSQQTVTRELQDAGDQDGHDTVYVCDTGESWAASELLTQRAWAAGEPDDTEPREKGEHYVD